MAIQDSEVIMAINELEGSSEEMTPSEYVSRIFAKFPGITDEQFTRCLDIAHADPGDGVDQSAVAQTVAEALAETGADCLAELGEGDLRVLSERLASLPKVHRN